MGDFYQISNQITLGKSETRTGQTGRRHRANDADRLRAPGPRFPGPREPRKPARQSQPGLRHSADRPDDQLRGDHAPALSSVRMGVNLGLIDDLENSHAQRSCSSTPSPPICKSCRGSGAGHGRPQHRARPLPPPASEQRKRRKELASFANHSLSLWERGWVRVLGQACSFLAAAEVARLQPLPRLTVVRFRGAQKPRAPAENVRISRASCGAFQLGKLHTIGHCVGLKTTLDTPDMENRPARSESLA